MKYCLVLSAILLASCSNPSLKWIGAPEDSAAGFSEIFFKIADPDLLPSSPNPVFNSAGTAVPDVVEVKVNLHENDSVDAGSGAPYTDPQWRLDGEPCSKITQNIFSGNISIGAGFEEKETYLFKDNTYTAIYIYTGSLVPGVHEVEVIVTGSDNNHYSDRIEVLVGER
jgi:hypothetical protein